MGITSMPSQGSAGIVSLLGHGERAFFQASTDPNAPTVDNDGVADPEISAQDLADLIAFSRFLAPPQRKASTPASDRGEAQFSQLGCVKCHLPSLPGSEGPVEAYTDLLIHDMGPGLADGISMGVPQSSLIS
ncbi:MAG: hypothetical protein KDB53_01465, partial [Planctomycetes bacterium]|nr:hypothetical protein [Planctomycetota bacterium]